MPGITLTVLPEKQEFQAEHAAYIMDALRQVGILLTAPCAGEGTCGKCRVRVERDGSSPPTPLEREILTNGELESGIRLACQARLCANTTLSIPPTSRATEMRVLLGGLSRKVALEPSVTKRFVQLPEQQLEGALSEFELLKTVLDVRADLRAGLDVLAELPKQIYGGNRQFTAIICGDQIVGLESGNTAHLAYGLALDVGTTTVVGTLIDLTTGKELAVASEVNSQTQFGHDVIARINFTLEHADGLAKLQEAAQRTIRRILAKVSASSGAPLAHIYEIVVVGNTTMSHLLLGISPQSLGHLPYVPVFSNGLRVPSAALGLDINPIGSVYVLPNIAGFVGADTVGAILAARFDEPDGRIRMLADIGTNCEIVLRYGDSLLACSTPAGPAFEGARIHHGMGAADGAIESVLLEDNGECTYKVIGAEVPRGLCGSGLVDIGAELLRVGVVDMTGRMLPTEELPDALPTGFKERLIARNGDLEFAVATPPGEPAVTLTQRDMRELQLAKAAVRAGIDILLQHVGLSANDLDELCIAGGFGSYLNKDNAIRLGLIPDMPRKRIRVIGNAAISGAKLVLLSQEMRKRAEIVARQVKHLQIAQTPDFQSQFMEAMLFL